MKETPLHKKKISEFGNDSIPELSSIEYTPLKQWALAVVKDIREIKMKLGKIHSYNVKMGDRIWTVEMLSGIEFFLIDCFELAEEDLSKVSEKTHTL